MHILKWIIAVLIVCALAIGYNWLKEDKKLCPAPNSPDAAKVVECATIPPKN
ncbi:MULTISPECIES: hypothetical protein [Kosakonia]|uniref:hypothetical protein n=1 Tax=Kosakonia TaxID=1330547 RepID=UPI001E627EFA|nr:MULTISPECIES: hypothetical protein [Kosakonia]